MLAPRFSLRAIFALMVAGALLSLIGVWAYQGNPWAAGVAMGVAVGGVMIAVQVLAFALFWAIGDVTATVFNRPRVPEQPDSQ